MLHALRFVQLLSCPVSVPMGIVLNADAEFGAVLSVWHGLLFVAATSFFVATTAWIEDRPRATAETGSRVALPQRRIAPAVGPAPPPEDR